MHPLARPHHSPACPVDLTQKHQCLSQCQTRPQGTVVTVPICSQTRSQPVRLAVGATARGWGGWGPSGSRSRSEPLSETLRLQRCWGQGTGTSHPAPVAAPSARTPRARCHHAIPTWASRPEPGLLPPCAGHRGQMAPGVRGRGRLLPTAPPPLLLLLAPGPAWATRRGSEMRRPAARWELPPAGCGSHRASVPRGHHGCQRLGAGLASRERKQHDLTSSWQRIRRAQQCLPAPCQPRAICGAAGATRCPLAPVCPQPGHALLGCRPPAWLWPERVPSSPRLHVPISLSP